MSKAVRSAEANRRRRRKHYWKRRNHVNAYKLERGCADCPPGAEWPWFVLQFDHVRGEKVANVSDLVSANAPWATIEAEMNKCDIVCANHHFIRSQGRFDDAQTTIWDKGGDLG